MAAGLILVGVASTAWQLTLTRVGILAFGPSAFALTVALAAHVLSLALGESLTALWMKRHPDAVAREALSTLCRWGAVGAMVALPVALSLPRMSMALLWGGAPSTLALWSAAMGCVLAATVPLVVFVGAALAQGASALEHDGATPAAANGAVLLATSGGNGGARGTGGQRRWGRPAPRWNAPPNSCRRPPMKRCQWPNSIVLHSTAISMRWCSRWSTATWRRWIITPSCAHWRPSR